MKKVIKNPYKVSSKIYIVLMIISLIILILSILLSKVECELLKIFCDVFKNLSYGCLASTLVAWLVDWANIRNLNKKAHKVYDAVYADLMFQIAHYIGLWAEMCSVAYKDIDYHKEKKTWKEWYFTVKENYNNAEEQRQKEILDFFKINLNIV